VCTDPPPPLRSAEADALMRELAAGQHGVVSTSQLLVAGVHRHLVRRRCAQGWLVRLARGVYRVGPIRASREAEMAAILLCGTGAAISHDTAARLRGLVPGRPEPRSLTPSLDGGRSLTPSRGVGRSRANSRGDAVHVTVRSGGPRSRPGLRVHRSRTLLDDEVTMFDGIPVTTPPRTLLDIAQALRVRELEKALARAERLGLATRSEMEVLLERHPRRSGIRALRHVLGLTGGPAFTRSEAEARFLALVRKGGLPEPRANVRIAGHEVDFLWRNAGLVVEIDGFAFHRSRADFERDRSRSATLTAAGFRVVRFTWRQLAERREVVLVRLGQALARGTMEAPR